jgi:very-short-patch-repair endonuclease
MKTDALRFKRQYPIGPYVVDFCCTSVKLIIEVTRNGESIRPPDAYDQMRIGYLEAAGYNVLRFSENDIREHSETIVAAVRTIISMSHPAN